MFSEDGEMLGRASVEYDLIYPGAEMVEFEPERYWSACVDSVRKVLRETKVSPKEILSLGVSSQGETFIPVDRRGEPLRRAVVWLDDRSTEESKEIERRFGIDEVFRATGQNEILPMWTATKILWLKKNEPHIFKQVYKYLLVEDYLIYRLTGAFATEYSVVSSSLLFNISRKEWWQEMLGAIGISEDQLPDLKPSGEYVGSITDQASKETGLHTKTIVSTGAYDHAAGAVGAGNIESGLVTETTGTALALVATTDDPVYDPKRRMPCHKHAVEDKYFLSPWGKTAGMVLKWFRDNFCQEEVESAGRIGKDAYGIMDSEASKVEPGSDGLVILPHLMGAGCPELNIDARGVVFGVTPNHTKAHFIRGILESVAYMLRRNIDLLEDLNVETKEIVSLGGGARSRLWKQIKADVTQKPVLTTGCVEAACLGAAILSGRAAGLFRTIREGVDSMVSIEERQEPRLESRETYTHLFSVYKDLSENLAPLFKKARKR